VIFHFFSFDQKMQKKDKLVPASLAPPPDPKDFKNILEIQCVPVCLFFAFLIKTKKWKITPLTNYVS